ncbi:MAG TPA: 16S rRNA (adenine(1518)-N(6)/adenine(1519)-N(6))-dimethyltransferase RsmA [Phycisphaerales bacterium]|nr:16S rRNA (adenine(1518)-N(6)/adenine(1519)-N(6))-dimethyltransferase RsmA [Phycisphaerales bacterium]
MQTLSEIRELLEARGLSPKRSLGQNFLVDHQHIRALVDASGVKAGDLVLEVGPGTGTMTEELLDRGCRVVACELDDQLSRLVDSRMTERLRRAGVDPASRFRLVHADCLQSKRALNPSLDAAMREMSAAMGSNSGEFHLVANLPYGAATPLLLVLICDHPACRSMSVTVQKELADRLLAVPGSRDYGPIGVVAQLACDVERLAVLPGGCFWPPPDVTSAMIRLVRKPASGAPSLALLQRTSRVAEALFQQRRKQIGAVYRQCRESLRLPTWEELTARSGSLLLGLSPTSRAEQLTPEQFQEIAASAGGEEDNPATEAAVRD